MVWHCCTRRQIGLLPQDIRTVVRVRCVFVYIPFIYVISKVLSAKAKAVYSYTGGNADELPFAEGDTLSIVDKSEGDWWKAEQGGVVFIVPAAYLELVEG